MGGATRLMTLLPIPFPPLRSSVFLFRRCVSTLSSFPVRPLTFSCPSKIKSHTRLNSFHSQPSNFSQGLQPNQKQPQRHDHPWPEWSHFLRILSNEERLCAPGDNGILPEDAFVVYEKLPDDFVRTAASCLAFARARPNLLGVLSRRHIEAVVSNGTPFLFKSALDAARRMRTFLETDGHTVSEVDQASTLDLMKYILSYASNPTVSSEGNGLYSRELVDSSVRNLLHELGTVTCGAPTGYVPVSHHHLSGRPGVSPHIGQNIEMKRGDWICPKCNFMNFARNVKCLECEQPRPRRQLAGGEWECPQCNFFNYGRNKACLRCDCRRPGVPLFNTMNSRSGLEYNGEYSFKTSIDTRLAENAEKAHHLSNNNSQLNNKTDINNAASCQAGPEIVPHQTRTQTLQTDDGKNISVGDYETAMSDDRDQKPVSSKSQSSGENLPVSKNSASEMDTQKKVKDQAEQPARWFKRMMELHDSKDLPSTVSDDDFPEMMPLRKGENQFVVSKNKDRSLTSPKYNRQVAMDQANDTNFVPFVPFPPGYFARKDTEQSDGPNSPVKTRGDTSSGKGISETGRSIDSTLGMADTNNLQSNDNQQNSSANSQFSAEIVAPPAGSPIRSSTTSHSVGDARAVEYPEKGNASQAATGGAPSRQPGDENVRSGWTGKSLEGSAVKEPDPLDMSEEAKAERWFKRVAQIKDISELSQIPDEDFPSIMPMRKGVNRFVVSKRKTPLERRLTSQQYRRNLPIVRNDPLKKESDDS